MKIFKGLIMIKQIFFCLSAIALHLSKTFCDDVNNTLVKQYDEMVCNNEPSCTLVIHFGIPEDRRNLDKRNCMCDEECKQYTDCCYDSPFYKLQEQILPQIYYCPPTINVYMKTNCPASWHDDYIARQCEKSMEALESDDVMVILPVTNLQTKTTYGNAFCAYCHNDRNFQPWLLVPTCQAVEFPPPPPPPPPSEPTALFYNTNSAQPRTISLLVELTPTQSYMLGGPPVSTVLDIFLYQGQPNGVNGITHIPATVRAYPVNGYSKSTARSKRHDEQPKYHVPYDHAEVWKYAKFDETTKKFISFYNDIKFECQIGPKLPDNLRALMRTCVPHVVDTCPPNTDPVQLHYCREFTSIIYNKYSKRAYKNKYCAYCNSELKAYLSGCIHKSEDTFFKSFQPSFGGLSGGINPCSRPGANKVLNCV